MTEKQWLKLYQDTVHPLYGYVSKRTGGIRELTEDIVQEAYLRALNSWTRKSLPDTPLAWLQRVARNILVDYVRQKKRDVNIDLINCPDNTLQQPKAQFTSLETFLAISSLGRKKAKILEAFYYDGMSVREIANTMEISERAVEGKLRRARQSLKSLLPEIKPNGGKNEQNSPT
jgi:RNA polymerase sigma factor (sigma-70 family)